MSVDLHAMVDKWYESGEVLPVFRIDYTGVARAYDKYKSLERMFVKLTTQMANDGMEYESADIRMWMRSSSGFSRAHTPYWVEFTTREWKEYVKYIRKYQPDWYSHLRYYGGWTHD